MQETVDESIEENILEISNIEKADSGFENIDGNWYGPLGFEFRSDEPVEMVELFRQERDEDTIYYKSGEKIGEDKYRFYFIVKNEETKLEERPVGRFKTFEQEIRDRRQRLEDIPEVNDGFVFDEEDFDSFLLKAKEKLVEPDTPVSLHYLTPDSMTENDEGEKVAEGVAINSNVYIRKQNGTIYELKPQNSDD